MRRRHHLVTTSMYRLKPVRIRQTVLIDSVYRTLRMRDVNAKVVFIGTCGLSAFTRDFTRVYMSAFLSRISRIDKNRKKIIHKFSNHILK